MREGEVLLAELDVQPLQVDYVEALVVFLYGRADHHLLLLVVDVQLEDLLWIGQVSDAPLEALKSIPAQEDGLSGKRVTVLEALMIS